METPPADALLLRPMIQEDVADMAELARAQGRNVGADEYVRFLALEGARGYVITRDGVLLGAATGMRYFEHGFLGPVLLREDEDAVGVAIALLAQLIEAIQREGCNVIDAEAAGTEEVILGRMGFQPVRRTLIMERPASAALAGAPLVREAPAGSSVVMEDHHLLDVGALDAQVVGFGRKEYLMALRREFPDGARVVERDGEVVGFVLARRSPRGYHIGPLITRPEHEDAARALLRDAVAASAGAAIVALVPEHAPVVALAESEGFLHVGALSRMRAGGAGAPGDGDAATEWALGGRIDRMSASEPIARGAVVVIAGKHREPLAVLAKESLSILKSLNVEARSEPAAPADADFVLLLVDEGSLVDGAPLPDMKDRAAVVVGIADDVPLCRGVIARARRRLRVQGATLGARELVFSPSDFGYLGLESDGLRERLEILLRALTLDGERLRLRREGWEEPDE